MAGTTLSVAVELLANLVQADDGALPLGDASRILDHLELALRMRCSTPCSHNAALIAAIARFLSSVMCSTAVLAEPDSFSINRARDTLKRIIAEVKSSDSYTSHDGCAHAVLELFSTVCTANSTISVQVATQNAIAAKSAGAYEVVQLAVSSCNSTRVVLASAARARLALRIENVNVSELVDSINTTLDTVPSLWPADNDRGSH